MAKRTNAIERKLIQEEWLANKSIVKISQKYKRDPDTIRRTIENIRHLKDPDLIRRVNNINDYAFDMLNDETAYWIGFLFADGNIYYDKRKLDIRQEKLVAKEYLQNEKSSTSKLVDWVLKKYQLNVSTTTIKETMKRQGVKMERNYKKRLELNQDYISKNKLEFVDS